MIESRSLSEQGTRKTEGTSCLYWRIALYNMNYLKETTRRSEQEAYFARLTKQNVYWIISM